MECNREEAEKAMARAEAKFLSHDLDGASRMAIKAHSLYPSLPNLKNLMVALCVHLAAAKEKIATGATNWFSILNVDPSDDPTTIRKQYKKLCILVHPDKNRSAAAEAAFKLVNEAWTVVSGGFDNFGGDDGSSGRPNAAEGSSSSDQKSSSNAHQGCGPGASNGSKNTQNEKDSDTHQGSGSWPPKSSAHSSDTSSHSEDGGSGSSSAQPSAPEDTPQSVAVCPKCSGMCNSVDPCGLVFRCQACNLLAVRQNRGGVFGVMIDVDNIDIYGGSKMSVNLHKVDGLEIGGESSIQVHRCDGVNIKGGSIVNVNRCDNVTLSGSGNVRFG